MQQKLVLHLLFLHFQNGSEVHRTDLNDYFTKKCFEATNEWIHSSGLFLSYFILSSKRPDPGTEEGRRTEGRTTGQEEWKWASSGVDRGGQKCRVVGCRGSGSLSLMVWRDIIYRDSTFPNLGIWRIQRDSEGGLLSETAHFTYQKGDSGDPRIPEKLQNNRGLMWAAPYAANRNGKKILGN